MVPLKKIDSAAQESWRYSTRAGGRGQRVHPRKCRGQGAGGRNSCNPKTRKPWDLWGRRKSGNPETVGPLGSTEIRKSGNRGTSRVAGNPKIRKPWDLLGRRKSGNAEEQTACSRQLAAGNQQHSAGQQAAGSSSPPTRADAEAGSRQQATMMMPGNKFPESAC